MTEQPGRSAIAFGWVVIVVLGAWPLGLSALQSLSSLEVQTDGAGATGLSFTMIVLAMILAPILAVAAAAAPLRRAVLVGRARAWLAVSMAGLSWVEASVFRTSTEALPGQFAPSLIFFLFLLAVPTAAGGALLFFLAGSRSPNAVSENGHR